MYAAFNSFSFGYDFVTTPSIHSTFELTSVIIQKKMNE